MTFKEKKKVFACDIECKVEKLSSFSVYYWLGNQFYFTLNALLGKITIKEACN